MILLTQYFKHTSIKRQNEIDVCVLKNCDNQYIDNIILFTDKNQQTSIKHAKITYVYLNTRLKYKHCIDYANKNLQNQTCIISNIDIYFNDTLKHISIDNNTVYAITRSEIEDNKIIIKQNHDSQDTWVFVAPLNVYAPILLGCLGCDNKFAYILNKAGYILKNPAKTIQCIHHHKTKNHYTTNVKIPPPYYFVPIE